MSIIVKLIQDTSGHTYPLGSIVRVIKGDEIYYSIITPHPRRTENWTEYVWVCWEDDFIVLKQPINDF